LLGLRLFWIAMLLLGTVLQPVLVVACETHESQHLTVTGHGHDNVEHEGNHVADEPLPADEVTPWHSLLHQGHCCVHGAAIVDLILTASPHVSPSRPECARQVSLIKAILTPTLRPPIRG